jgi:hypothetical protein
MDEHLEIHMEIEQNEGENRCQPLQLDPALMMGMSQND